MSQIITDSLQLAAEKGFTSIALPAMGTGNLRFPRDVVADTMFKTVMDFSKANPGTSVKDVRFVLYDRDHPTIDVSPCWKTFLPTTYAVRGKVMFSQVSLILFRGRGGREKGVGYILYSRG